MTPDPALGPGPWGVYVHVPWCRRRCPYCSFYVEVDRGPNHGAFTDVLLREHDQRRAAFDALGAPSTLFFGGGTPSRLPPRHVARLIDAMGLAPDAEVTLEANPEDLTEDVLDGLVQAGVTRLSIGLQTFNPRFARLLNRASTVSQAREALARVARAGLRSWSVDLIFGLPDQTLDDLEHDLDALVAVRPPHVALYGLTYEPGTPFARARDRGRFVETDEDTARAMIDRIHARLTEDLGLGRYEISTYARRGHSSRHNTLYWTDRPYLGLGPSAHGYAPDGRRWANVADVDAYLTREDPTDELEQPDPWQAAADLLVSGLRHVDGVDRERLRRRTGLDVDEAELARLADLDLLVAEPGRVRLLDAGVPVADGVSAKLAETLRAAR